MDEARPLCQIRGWGLSPGGRGPRAAGESPKRDPTPATVATHPGPQDRLLLRARQRGKQERWHPCSWSSRSRGRSSTQLRERGWGTGEGPPHQGRRAGASGLGPGVVLLWSPRPPSSPQRQRKEKHLAAGGSAGGGGNLRAESVLWGQCDVRGLSLQERRLGLRGSWKLSPPGPGRWECQALPHLPARPQTLRLLNPRPRAQAPTLFLLPSSTCQRTLAAGGGLPLLLGTWLRLHPAWDLRQDPHSQELLLPPLHPASHLLQGGS